MEKMKIVYLAGPDVFRKDAIQIGEEYVYEAKKRNLFGIFPIDNEVKDKDQPNDILIYKKNRELIDKADFVVANLNPFRGQEPDSGTVWEVAYAIAKDKIVIGYLHSNKSILEKLQEQGGVTEENGSYFDSDGMLIENFGQPLNLMLQHSLTEIVYGTIETALDKVRFYATC